MTLYAVKQIILAIFLGAESHTNSHVTVIISTNITNSVCTDQSVLLTCHTDDVTNPSYQWTSSVDQLNWTSSDILVTASDHVVNYTCTVTSDDDKGNSTISIFSNGEQVVIVTQWQVLFRCFKRYFCGFCSYLPTTKINWISQFILVSPAC